MHMAGLTTESGHNVEISINSVERCELVIPGRSVKTELIGG